MVLAHYGKFISRHSPEITVISVIFILFAAFPFLDLSQFQSFANHHGFSPAKATNESLELWKEQAHIYVNTSETPLNKETMLRILDLHTALENTKIKGDDSTLISLNDVCYKNVKGNGHCLLYSIGQYWSMSKEEIMNDDNFEATLNRPSVSGPGFNVNREFVYTQNDDLAKFTFTYFVKKDPNRAHFWRNIWKNVLSGTSWISRYANQEETTKVMYWQEQRTQSSGVLILILCNSVPIFYAFSMFVKFRRNLGSKYILGITSLVAVFSSFLITIRLFHYLSVPLTLVISEVIPFLFVVIGMENTHTLSRMTKSEIFKGFNMKKETESTSDTRKKNKEDIAECIGRSFSLCFPSLTIDCMFKLFSLMLGNAIGIPRLGETCLFASVSLIVNHFLFSTFYLAILSLKLEQDRLLMLLDTMTSNKSAQKHKAREEELKKEETNNKLWTKSKPKILVLFSLICGVYYFSLSQQEPLVTPEQKIQSLSVDQELLRSAAPWTAGATLLSHPSDFTMSIQLCPPPLETCPQLERHLFTIRDLIYECAETFRLQPVKKIANFLPEDILMIDTEILMLIALFALVGASLIHYVFTEEEEPELDVATSNLDTLLQPEYKCMSPAVPSKTEGATAAARKSSSSGSAERKESFHASFSIGGESDSPNMTPNTSTTDLSSQADSGIEELDDNRPMRSVADAWSVFSADGADGLSDKEIISLVNSKKIPAYRLEKACGDFERGVRIRRTMFNEELKTNEILKEVPYTQLDYTKVVGVCCENILGYIPIPVGIVGPIQMNDKMYTVPMSTTEGCLLASTHRGCKAINESGGANTILSKDGMTRAPAVTFDSVVRCNALVKWLEVTENFKSLKAAFESTSRFAKLLEVGTKIAGRTVYLRFCITTGDAMGMNMISKGTEKGLAHLQDIFPDMRIISLSGNYCTDKKPAAVNWILGRGKSCVTEAIIKKSTVEKVLKTTVDALLELNVRKNLIGSAMAGSVGGFNAHASNIVTAIYLATGQDPAQNVESSQCITLMEKHGEDLYLSCSMPCIEVGTIGGGTQLPAQAACLKILGLAGANYDSPGQNAQTLAKIVCTTVMAGELSLLSALAAGHLVKSHLVHNRSSENLAKGQKKAETIH